MEKSNQAFAAMSCYGWGWIAENNERAALGVVAPAQFHPP